MPYKSYKCKGCPGIHRKKVRFAPYIHKPKPVLAVEMDVAKVMVSLASLDLNSWEQIH